MTPPRASVAVAVAGVLAAALTAATANAATAQPLVDRAPATTRFEERVLDASTARGAQPRATAAQAGEVSFPTRDGYGVRVAFTESYGVRRDVGRSYVDFLDSLAHGPELHTLRVLIAPPTEIGEICGGGDGVLACYAPATQRMVVPGEELATGNGPTTSYVVAHEYGHHIAANRSNEPFNALDFGPKLWASEERVCSRTIEHKLAPGDEGEAYVYNPGENWAEAYTRLKYPEQAWTFAPILKPDAAALAAARRDVLEPWTRQRAKTFRSTIGPNARTRTFTLPLRLDGRLSARVVGPAGSNVGLTITSGAKKQGQTTSVGRSHTLTFAAACRDRATENVKFHVTRRSGSGPVSVRVSYAG